MIDNGVLMAGTPDMVVDQIKRFYDHVGGFGHLLMMGHAGPLSGPEAMRSLELYSQHVAAAIAHLGSAPGPAGPRAGRARCHKRAPGADRRPGRPLPGDNCHEFR